jgi:YfiH family protein
MQLEIMNIIKADWQVPNFIKAFTTTHACGNMGLHVTNDHDATNFNRQQVLREFPNLAKPLWLTQVHGTDIVKIDSYSNLDENPKADASITDIVNQPLAIMTADCYPILLADQNANKVAAIHAGWRGTVGGIIEKTIKKLDISPQALHAWIGPGICVNCFEVGHDVFELCNARYDAVQFFIKKDTEKYLFNLLDFIKFVLQQNNVAHISSANTCTFENDQVLYSYRRDNNTGRMATFIWINE